MMKIIDHIISFSKDEDGAVTVDWVVLTSAVAALGIVVAVTVGSETKTVADKISSHIEATDLMTY